MWEVEEVGSVVSVATLEVNGAITELNIGDNLKEVVLQAARDAGLGKFKLFVNDVEILPHQATDLVEADTAYKIQAFDVAGLV